MNGLPQTPSPWREARAPDGRTYYYNSNTKETSWQKPQELLSPMDVALAAQPWNEHTAPDGRKYYAHKETKQTTWEMPNEYRQALNTLQSAQSQQQPPSRPASQAPAFVAGSNNTSLQQYQEPAYEPRRDFAATNGISIPVTKETIPDYASFEEAEAAFLKLLRRANVQPDWSWTNAMRATIKDPQYRALKDPKDRKAAFEKYTVEVRQQEKEKAKERLAKLRTDFGTMLRTHPEIKHFSKWKTIRPIIEHETVFRSTDNEDERKQLFEEYILELKKQHLEEEAARRKQALSDLGELLKALDLEPYTRWSQAQEVLASHQRMQSDPNMLSLSKSDVLTTFENHIKALERTFNDARQQQKNNKARLERQSRDRFAELLQEKRAEGMIKAGTKWSAFLPEIEADPRYTGMLGCAGSTPLELFWDALEEEERALRGRRMDVYDVLEDKRFEITSETSFDEFHDVILTDRRTANIDGDALRLIFQRLYQKVLKRNEDEKKDADRHKRRAIDALRSRIKHLEPPVRLGDTWDDVKARVDKSDEYRALETDDDRLTAFDKVMKRLREKDEDSERRRARRTDDRNGYRDGRPGRSPRSPEADPYEADRRRAMAAREKSYRKTSTGLSPPPSHRDRRGHDERYGRLDRSPGRLSVYERERRDREEERERLYRTRADPRSSRDELNYGEETKSSTTVASDGRRRRRGDSDAGSIDSGRRSKRYRAESHGRERDRERDRDRGSERRRSKSPADVPKEVGEPAGVHSGSEEGEIEED